MRNIFILLLIASLSYCLKHDFTLILVRQGQLLTQLNSIYYVWEVTIMNDNIGDTDSLYFWTENNPTKNRKFICYLEK